MIFQAFAMKYSIILLIASAFYTFTAVCQKEKLPKGSFDTYFRSDLLKISIPPIVAAMNMTASAMSEMYTFSGYSI